MIALDQSVGPVEITTGTEIVLTFTTAPAPGSLVVVEISQWDNVGTGITSMVDNQGNSYSSAFSVTHSSIYGRTALYYAENVSSSGTFTITVTVNTNTDTQVWAHSFTGVATSNSLLDTSTEIHTGFDNVAQTGVATTAETGALYLGVLGMTDANSMTSTWADSTVLVSNIGEAPLAVDYKITTGDQQDRWDLGGFSQWGAGLAVFSEAAVDFTEFLYSGDITVALSLLSLTSYHQIWEYIGDVTVQLNLLSETLEGQLYLYDGDVIVSLTPTSITIYEFIYTGTSTITLDVTSVTNYLQIWSYITDQSITLNLTSDYTYIFISEYSGNIPLVLIPNSIDSIDYVYVETIIAQLLPTSIYQEEQSLVGSIIVSLLPNSTYEQVIGYVYSGDISITLSLESEYIREIIYVGTNTLVLVPNSETLLVPQDVSVYIGNITLSIIPNSSYTRTYSYIGNSLVTLLSNSIYSFVNLFLYTGDIDLNIVPNSIIVIEYVETGTIEVEILPASIYTFTDVDVYTYTGDLYTYITLDSVYVRDYTYTTLQNIIFDLDSSIQFINLGERIYDGNVLLALYLNSDYERYIPKRIKILNTKVDDYLNINTTIEGNTKRNTVIENSKIKTSLDKSTRLKTKVDDYGYIKTKLD